EPELTQSCWELARGYTITFLASTTLHCMQGRRMARYHPAYLGGRDRFLQLYRADRLGSTRQILCCSSAALPDLGPLSAQPRPSSTASGGYLASRISLCWAACLTGRSTIWSKLIWCGRFTA